MDEEIFNFIICSFCDSKFSNTDLLKNHFESNHYEKINKPNEEGFTCKTNNCFTEFKYVSNLINHINTTHILQIENFINIKGEIIEEDEIVEEWLPEPIDFEKMVSECIEHLCLTTSITKNDFDVVIDSLENMILEVMSIVIPKINSFCKYKNICTNDESFKTFINQFVTPVSFCQYKQIREKKGALNKNNSYSNAKIFNDRENTLTSVVSNKSILDEDSIEHASTSDTQYDDFVQDSKTSNQVFFPTEKIQINENSCENQINYNEARIINVINNTEFGCRCKKKDLVEINKMKFDFKGWMQTLDEQSNYKHNIVEHLEKGMNIDHKKEIFIINFIGNKIKTMWGNCYPPHCLKLRVAKELVATFPVLKRVTDKDPEGYFYWSNGRDTMLDNFFKRIKNVLPDPEKKYFKKRKTTSEDGKSNKKENIMDYLEISNENLKKIEYLRKLQETADNKIIIFKLMEETRHMRSKLFDKNKLQSKESGNEFILGDNLFEIQNQSMSAENKEKLKSGVRKYSPCKILNEFPHFLSYCGFLILDEYNYYFSNDAINFVTLKSIIPKILKFCNNNDAFKTFIEQVSDITDVNAKAISVLPSILISKAFENFGKVDRDNKRGRKRTLDDQIEIPHRSFLRYEKLSDLREKECVETNKERNSPVLVSEKNTNIYYLYINNRLMFVEGGFLKALEILVKLQILMDINIPNGLDQFYNFIYGCVFKNIEHSNNSIKLFNILQEY